MKRLWLLLLALSIGCADGPEVPRKYPDGSRVKIVVSGKAGVVRCHVGGQYQVSYADELGSLHTDFLTESELEPAD